MSNLKDIASLTARQAGTPVAARKVVVWDPAGVERLVDPIDAKEIVAHGGSFTAPVIDEKPEPSTSEATEETVSEPKAKCKAK